MTLFYHAETRSFYDTAVHAADSIPLAAVKVTPDQKKKLLEGERTGQVIVIGDEGTPVLQAPPADSEAPTRLERAWRDTKLSSIEWIRDRHRDQQEINAETSLSQEQYAELLAYMQSLRDWPASPEFPGQEGRPSAPEWIGK